MGIPRPFCRLRGKKKFWYVKIGGRQYPLGSLESEVPARYASLVRQMGVGSSDGLQSPQHPISGDEEPIKAVVGMARFLAEYEGRVEGGVVSLLTVRNYRTYLRDLARHLGPHLLASEVEPEDIRAWLRKRPWGLSCHRTAIGAVKRCWRWMACESRPRILGTNPMRDLRNVKVVRRSLTFGPRELDRAVLEAPPHLADLIVLLAETGARPDEVRRVEGRDVVIEHEMAYWRLEHHKTASQTGKPRTVFLTDRALKITRKAMGTHKAGPLFRNASSRPWTKDALARSFARLRAKLDLPRGFTPYCVRHFAATRMLRSNQADVATVAALLGHTPKVLLEVYQHVADDLPHLARAASRIQNEFTSRSGSNI